MTGPVPAELSGSGRRRPDLISPRGEDPMNRSATYLYGLARAGTEVSADLTGIEEEAPVRVLEVTRLAAVVSEVAPGPFESDEPSDLDWPVPRAAPRACYRNPASERSDLAGLLRGPLSVASGAGDLGR
jgi:hypothetical protein